MSLLSKIRLIEKYANNEQMKDSVLFFDSQEEFDQAEKSGTIKNDNICIINDLAEDNE